MNVTEDGIVEVRFKIEAATTGAATVTESNCMTQIMTYGSLNRNP